MLCMHVLIFNNYILKFVFFSFFSFLGLGKMFKVILGDDVNQVKATLLVSGNI